MAPRVSVCIPTYNYANFIISAIESVLNQVFGDFELIVQDDCSSDNSEGSSRDFYPTQGSNSLETNAILALRQAGISVFAKPVDSISNMCSQTIFWLQGML